METYKQAFGTFLKAADVDGRSHVVTIKSVRREDIRGPKGTDRKFVARFVELEKSLILNRTNCDAIARLTGSEFPEQWGGIRVVLFAEPTLFGGAVVPGIRVRAPQKGE